MREKNSTEGEGKEHKERVTEGRVDRDSIGGTQ